MCVRMEQSVLSVIMALSASVCQGTKEHTVTVSKQAVMSPIYSLMLTLPKVKIKSTGPYTRQIQLTLCPKSIVLTFQPSELDHCKPNPCQHGGDCVETDNGFKCHCQAQYQGLRCEGRSTKNNVTSNA